MKRDSRLHDIAVRVDEYERARYEQHPRCVRPKRNTPNARVLSVEAITKALERVVATEVYPTLEDIEMRFRAVVELNWDGAERKLETWEWWTGSWMWAPLSLERCLGWLDEQRNEIYLLRARGVLVLPQRPSSDEPSPVDMAGLSPMEQQAEYDRQFSSEQVSRSHSHASVDSDTGAITYHQDAQPESIEDYKWETVGDDRVRKAHAEVSPFAEWLDEQEAAKQLSDCIDPAKPVSDYLRKIHDIAAQQLSDCIDLGDAPGLGELVRGMMANARPESEPSEDQLARTMRAKGAYVNGTTAEERAADVLAGRKPWEVG
jgi:hypothetical protein